MARTFVVEAHNSLIGTWSALPRRGRLFIIEAAERE